MTEVAIAKDREIVQNVNEAQSEIRLEPSHGQLTLFDTTLTEGEDRVAHAKEIAASKELSTEISSVELENEVESSQETRDRFSPAALAKYAAVGLGTAAVSVVGYKLVEQGVAESIAKWVMNDGIVFLGCIGLALATAVGRSSSKETKNTDE